MVDRSAGIYAGVLAMCRALDTKLRKTTNVTAPDSTRNYWAAAVEPVLLTGANTIFVFVPPRSIASNFEFEASSDV